MPTSALPDTPPQWEIFCKVVDNFGDIGVCWRLARDLAARGGAGVRLWVDDWASLARLCPAAAALAPAQGGVVDGVVLRHWVADFPALPPGEVVIEAFACELPERHLQAMAAAAQPPLWINLEYLSAEDWVSGCHGLASPHPRLGLVKHFFFPGFDAGTGGLLREPGLLTRRDAFRRAPDGRRAWLAARGLAGLAPETVLVSLFAYGQAGIASLLAAWQAGPRPIVVLVPEGRVLADLAAALGCAPLAVGARVTVGRLTLAVLPFTAQEAYDELLWACDLNFVRGEDSFVRAQWAAVPMVWHIYPQQDDAHHTKLEAFMARYCAGLPTPAADALTGFWRAWNGRGDPGAAWPAFAAALPALQAHAHGWCEGLAARPDLVENLLAFCSHLRFSNR